VTPSRVLVAAWFPGAMRAVAPLGRALSARGCRVGVVCTATAAPIAARFAMDAASIVVLPSDATADQAMRAHAPEVAVLGVGEGTAPERQLLAYCRRFGVPTLAVLDTWGDYARRLSTAECADVLAVMSDAVLRDIRRGGFWPAAQVVAAGHPGLEEFLVIASDESARREARRRLGLREDGELAVFFSQPIQEVFGDALGYTQLDAVRALGRRLPDDVDWVIAAHPREVPARLGEAGGRRARVLDSYDPAQLYVAANVVSSCFSACLVEAALCSRSVVSIQPGLRGPDRCWASHLGIAETATDESAIEAAFSRARAAARTPSELERRRRAVGLVPGAVDRLLDIVSHLAGGERPTQATRSAQPHS
jgi:hypothetical protein